MARETAVLLADAGSAGFDEGRWVDADDGSDGGAPATLLGRLQYNIRHDTTSTLDQVGTDDRSVQFHACFGPMRQAEVARDAVLHILADDPSLDEEDVLVVCPGLERFAPLVEAAFEGPSRDDRVGAPALRFQIADRSLRSANPVVGALLQLLDLVSGRFEVPPVVDFISSAPVRLRFGLDDRALGVVTEWVGRTHVRWGLDAVHRTGFGMPAAVGGNTWQAALDRLLLGATTVDDRLVLAIGDVAPSAVDGGDVDVLGALAAILGHLADLAAWADAGRHPLAAWIDRLESSCAFLLAAPEVSAWQFDALHRVLGEILDASGSADHGDGPRVDLRDVRRLLDGWLGNEAGRPDFFRGGVTVTSMTPLRWVPFRVVCILGLDQEFIGAPASDAADLVAASPQLGDPDRRIEWRQSLLETVLSAQDHLVVVRDGQDVRTGQVVPRAVAVAELVDAVVGLAPPGQQDELEEHIEVQHPRHGFDETCLEPGGLVPGVTWSFDPDDLRRAEARRSADPAALPAARPVIDVVRTDVIDLADLRVFLADPVAAFAASALQIGFPRIRDTDDVILPVEAGPLERANLGQRLLEARRDGASTVEWLDVERRAGTLPPGALEARATLTIEAEVDALVDEAVRRGIRTGDPDLVDLEVSLDDGTRIVGSVPLLLPDGSPGPARVRFARSRPAFTLEAWLHLVALVAAEPDRSWRSVFLCRGDADWGCTAVDLVAGGSDGERATVARTALGVAVECYRAGMREPLPLFPRFSKSVADGAPDFSAWSGTDGRGDRRSPATSFFFGALNGTELMAIPAVEGDPGSAGGRVQRWADHLWGTVAATSREYASVTHGAGSPFDPLGPLPAGRVVIEASAGTGKTFTLAALATRYLAEQDMTPSDLLIVTFTRAATAELRSRSGASWSRRRPPWPTTPAATTTWCATWPPPTGTSDGDGSSRRWPTSTRRRSRRSTGSPPRSVGHWGSRRPSIPTRLAAGNGDLILAACADALAAASVRPVPPDHFPSLRALVDATAAKVGGPDLRLVPDGSDPDVDPGFLVVRDLVVDAVRRLGERRLGEGSIGFDDVLVQLRDALGSDDSAAVVDALRSRYQVVLIDEFQDTDRVQWESSRPSSAAPDPGPPSCWSATRSRRSTGSAARTSRCTSGPAAMSHWTGGTR